MARKPKVEEAMEPRRASPRGAESRSRRTDDDETAEEVESLDDFEEDDEFEDDDLDDDEDAEEDAEDDDFDEGYDDFDEEFDDDGEPRRGGGGRPRREGWE